MRERIEKVKVTDIPTSIRLYRKYGYHNCPINTEFAWEGRCDKLTDAQIAKGKEQNPQAVVFTGKEFKEMLPDDEDVNDSEGYSVRLWPVKDSLGMYMHFSFPAYQTLPKGETGTFIEITIDNDNS